MSLLVYIISFILVFGGCATRPQKTTGYRYYVLDLQAKTLNGPTPEDDQSLQSCWDVNGEKYKCIVMYTDTFYKLKEELDDLRLRDKLTQKYMQSGDQ